MRAGNDGWKEFVAVFGLGAGRMDVGPESRDSSKSSQIPESTIHCGLLAQPWIPNALFNVVKNGMSCGSDSFRQFAPIRLAYRRFVQRFPIRIGIEEHRNHTNGIVA
jgi:hypothetical protein